MKPCLFIIVFIIHATASAQVFDSVLYCKKYPPKALHEDIDFLLKKFEAVHPNYFKELSRDSVLNRYNSLKNQISIPLTKLDFLNLVCPAAFNVVKDGHNFVNGGTEEETKMYIDRGGKFFPLPVIIEKKRLFVNSQKAELPFWSEIIMINNVPAQKIIDKILSMYNAESDEFEERFMSAWFSNSYWTSFGGYKSYALEYRSPGSSSIQKATLQGRDIQEIDKLRIVSNKKNYRFYDLSEIQAGVLEYNACEDLKNFRPFCDSVFTLCRDKGYKNLIIDIRENIGGTTRLNDVLLECLTSNPVRQFEQIETKISKDKKRDYKYQNRRYAGWFKWYHYLYYPLYLRQNDTRQRIMTAKNGTFVKQQFEAKRPKYNPLLFEGKIFLLTSRKTYSSAASLAAACKEYNIATIIGQETGEPTCFTADWVPVKLPNTQLVFAISSQRFILAGGKCDGKGVEPDYPTGNAIGEEAGDFEMDFVKNLILGKAER